MVINVPEIARRSVTISKDKIVISTPKTLTFNGGGSYLKLSERGIEQGSNGDMTMMIKYIILFFLFFSFFSYGEDFCLNVENSEQVFLCSKNKKDAADKYLNERYLALLSKVNSEYANDSYLKKEFLNNIRMAQRDWIKFRDYNCKLHSFQIDSKSQAYQTTFNECVAKMSESRGTELEDISNGM